MANIITIIIIAMLIIAAVLYVYKSKKRGNKCIGCPYGCNCSKKESCGSKKENEN